MRPLTYLRSLAFEPQGGAAALRRASHRGKIPVRVAPLDRYLKAKGSQPPRTWVSGLADRVRRLGCGHVVDAAQVWFRDSVTYLLTDPKDADQEGDYFTAYLRAVHRNIYDDIDRSDPAEMRRRKWAPSMRAPKSKKARHDLGSIRIPGVEDAFAELAKFDPDTRISTGRERVLAKIMVDAFNIRLTDLAMILKVAEVAALAPAGAPAVVVIYAGEDHSCRVSEFWCKLGFSSHGLPDRGVVGKRDWEDDEPRSLRFPPCLLDVKQLFPVPQ